MKSLIATFLFLSSTAALAFNPENSRALEGHYYRISATTDWAKLYHCSKEVNVSVSQYGVSMTSDGPTHEGFSVSQKGCRRSDSETGFVGDVDCVRIGSHSASWSSTEPISIVGYSRLYTGISVQGNLLTYTANTTQIPFGITGLWDKDEFTCVYKKIDLE